MLFSKKKKSPFNEEFYLSCHNKMIAAVNIIFRDPELAKDAVQEGLYRALRNYDQLRDKNKFCSWATRIAINYAKDMNRKNSRQLSTDVIDAWTEKNSSKEDEFDTVGDFVLLKYDVEKVLAELNDNEREILILKYFLDYSTEEIAIFLDITTQNVNQRLRRARERYRIIAKKCSSDGLGECGS